MYMFDNRISIENRGIIEEYLNGYEYRTSGLSFTSLYMWRDINQFSWEIVGDYMCLSGVSHLELVDLLITDLMMPRINGIELITEVRKIDRDIPGLIITAKEMFEDKGYPFSLRLVPVHMLDIIKEACPEINFEDDRPNYDYIYRVQDLVELKGRAYHSKKNHLNYFKKTYQYQYAELTSDMADEVMKFISDFNRKKEIPPHEMELLVMEEEAMEDVFRNLEKVGYIGGAILIEGNIEAVAVGGMLGSDTVTEHVEKANTDFRGLYQLVLNEFCRHVSSRAEYLNREEDMDIENLRKSKLSYKPVELLEKYIGTFE